MFNYSDPHLKNVQNGPFSAFKIIQGQGIFGDEFKRVKIIFLLGLKYAFNHLISIYVVSFLDPYSLQVSL